MPIPSSLLEKGRGEKMPFRIGGINHLNCIFNGHLDDIVGGKEGTCCSPLLAVHHYHRGRLRRKGGGRGKKKKGQSSYSVAVPTKRYGGEGKEKTDEEEIERSFPSHHKGETLGTHGRGNYTNDRYQSDIENKKKGAPGTLREHFIVNRLNDEERR